MEGVPHAWFALLRREAPLRWQDEESGRGYWSLTRYEDIVNVSKDFGTYSSETGGTSLEDLTPSQVEARKSMLDTDPAATHAACARSSTRASRPRSSTRMRSGSAGLRARHPRRRIREGGVRLGRGRRRRAADVGLLGDHGLPVEDRKLLIELGDKLLGNTDPEVVGEELTFGSADLTDYKELPFSSPYARDLIEYGSRLGDARRAEPRDDVTTRLVEAEVEGERLDDREFGVFFILLTTAGNETTRHTISLGLQALLEHPEEAARLQSPIRRSPRRRQTRSCAVAHPVHHFRRTATRDVDLHGQTIRDRRQGGDLVRVGQLRRGEVRRSVPLRRRPLAEPSPHVRARRAALLPRCAPREARGARSGSRR